MPPGTILRVLLLATLAAVGAGWGLVHHYGAPQAPMLVPAQPPAAPTYDADAGERPAPDLEPIP